MTKEGECYTRFVDAFDQIVDKENDIRRLQFEKFMNYSKRQLRISPDSFLFKIRTFKLST